MNNTIYVILIIQHKKHVNYFINTNFEIILNIMQV